MHLRSFRVPVLIVGMNACLVFLIWLSWRIALGEFDWDWMDQTRSWLFNVVNWPLYLSGLIGYDDEEDRLLSTIIIGWNVLAIAVWSVIRKVGSIRGAIRGGQAASC